MVRVCVLLALAALAGCVDAPVEALGTQAAAGAALDAAATLYHETHRLTANDLQTPVSGHGLGMTEPSCLALQAEDGEVLLRDVTVVARWEAVAPTQATMYLEMAPEEPLPERLAAEGPSPLTLRLENLTIAEDTQVDLYLGAPRGGGIALKQPFELDVSATYGGTLDVYEFSCTIAG